jgi:hypothetical protein
MVLFDRRSKMLYQVFTIVFQRFRVQPTCIGIDSRDCRLLSLASLCNRPIQELIRATLTQNRLVER